MTKFSLPLLILLTLLGRAASACDNPPCSDPVSCPEGETCLVTDEDEATPPSLEVAPPAAVPAPVAPAVTETAQVEAAPVPPPSPTAKPRVHHYGVGLNVGIPDGAGLDFYLRPAKWVRASVGGTYNSIAPGFHGGLTLAPFGWGPSATAEVGHSFQGDVNSVYHTHEPALSSVGYYYADLHGGWEFGYKRATFFIHAGESYIEGQVRNVNQQLNSQQVMFTKNPQVDIWVPSFKFGLIIFFE